MLVKAGQTAWFLGASTWRRSETPTWRRSEATAWRRTRRRAHGGGHTVEVDVKERAPTGVWRGNERVRV
jgi:hypothetical protein